MVSRQREPRQDLGHSTRQFGLPVLFVRGDQELRRGNAEERERPVEERGGQIGEPGLPERDREVEVVALVMNGVDGPQARDLVLLAVKRGYPLPGFLQDDPHCIEQVDGNAQPACGCKSGDWNVQDSLQLKKGK